MGGRVLRQWLDRRTNVHGDHGGNGGSGSGSGRRGGKSRVESGDGVSTLPLLSPVNKPKRRGKRQLVV